jgi:hypothetical protein
MEHLDLRPYSQKITIRKGDAVILRQTFREMKAAGIVPIDIRSFRIFARLWMFVDGKKLAFPLVEQSNTSVEAGKTPNYIYLDKADESNSTVVFAADWVNESGNGLDEGRYQLDFVYSSSQSYPKTYASYELVIDNNFRDDSPVSIGGTQYFLLTQTENMTINIYNSLIESQNLTE